MKQKINKKTDFNQVVQLQQLDLQANDNEQEEPSDFDSFNKATSDIIFKQVNAENNGIQSAFEQEIAAEIEINAQYDLVIEDPAIDEQDLKPLEEELAAEIE